MSTRRTGTNARTVSTSLRFPVDEYLRIKRAAAKAHLSVSDYIRRNVPEASINYWQRQEGPTPMT